MRRSLTAVLLAVAVVAGLTGCYPTAANAIGDLERFALQLDGVESVETLEDTPENMAFPFGGTALGTAAIHLGDTWPDDLPDVAVAVQDWLATGQKREKVTLSVGIVYPFGALGLASTEGETKARLDVVEALADDPAITGVSIGFSPYGSIDSSNADSTITIGRNADVTIAEIVADHHSILSDLAPNGTLEVVIDDDLTDIGSDDDASRRDLETRTSIDPAAPLIAWVDAIDAHEAITGWRVADDGEATVYASDAAQLDSLDAELRSLPGFAALRSLTLVSPQLSVESEAGDSTAARELATVLAAAGFSEVTVSGGELIIDSIDADDALLVLATAASVPGAEDVVADLEISLGVIDSNPCACIRMRDATLGYLSSVLPPLLELDPGSLDQIWVRAETAIDASYESDDRAAMGAFFAAVHEQAIARGTSVAVSTDSGNDYYIVMFDAAPQITADDVWSGNNNAPQDKRHAAIIDLWNSLDN